MGIVNKFGYATQPNHGINIKGNLVWATNLLFGAPLELDLKKWRSRRVLRYLEPEPDCPQVSSTSHFAWSLDGRYAYFHQSLLEKESPGRDVRARRLVLVELDSSTLAERIWDIIPPRGDPGLETANFHSAFYFEEYGQKFVGMLRTGAWLETLAEHSIVDEHSVRPMPFSVIWIIPIQHDRTSLQAETLIGIERLKGMALSHLDVDARGGDGFVLFANFKQADVAEESHGPNIYGESADEVQELYAGMTVEAINYGMIMRLERRDGLTQLKTFSRNYDPSNTSLGHSWLPINIEIDPSGEYVFGSFSGFRPRLLSRHIARAYSALSINPSQIRYVPPVLIRFRSDTLEVDTDRHRGHLSYAEPMAMTVVGDASGSFVCTFSPEAGLRIYATHNLSSMICQANAPEFMNWGETHFRPEPAHMKFVPS